MIAMGFQNVVTGQWWPSLFPGLALALTVFGFSLVGASIEVLADPAKRRALAGRARDAQRQPAHARSRLDALLAYLGKRLLFVAAAAARHRARQLPSGEDASRAIRPC